MTDGMQTKTVHLLENGELQRKLSNALERARSAEEQVRVLEQLNLRYEKLIEKARADMMDLWELRGGRVFQVSRPIPVAQTDPSGHKELKKEILDQVEHLINRRISSMESFFGDEALTVATQAPADKSVTPPPFRYHHLLPSN